MKNKAKPVKVKKYPRAEVKRPATKKSRPKKYVEAKIPNLPPVPTKVVEAKTAPICAIHVDATKFPCLDCMKSNIVVENNGTVKFEIPKELLGPQTPEERFVELLNKAADELKVVADNLSVVQPRHPIPKTIHYKSGGIGAVCRLETGEDQYKFAEQVAEELKREAVRQEVWRASHQEPEIIEVGELDPEPTVDPELIRIVNLKKEAAKYQTTVQQESTKKNWFARAVDAILKSKK